MPILIISFVLIYLYFYGSNKDVRESISEVILVATSKTESELHVIDFSKQSVSNSNKVKANISDITKEKTETTVPPTKKESKLEDSVNKTEINQINSNKNTVTSENTLSKSKKTEVEDCEQIFSGILIDSDCSDIENPTEHDLTCMLMYECRDSGYGIDILQEDGRRKFYYFDKKGNELAWEYLNKTTRMDGLYVNVTGKMKNDIIIVSALKES